MTIENPERLWAYAVRPGYGGEDVFAYHCREEAEDSHIDASPEGAAGPLSEYVRKDVAAAEAAEAVRVAEERATKAERRLAQIEFASIARVQFAVEVAVSATPDRANDGDMRSIRVHEWNVIAGTSAVTFDGVHNYVRSDVVKAMVTILSEAAESAYKQAVRTIELFGKPPVVALTPKAAEGEADNG